jgi:hypothetical protein
MSNALAKKTPSDSLTFEEIKDMGLVFLKSGFFADIKDASQAVVKIMYGRELGLEPITALMSIHIIKGKPELSANLLATLVKKAPQYDYMVKTTTDQECVIEFTQDGVSLGVSQFSISDAKRAGLVGGGSGWTKWPKAMLFARAMSQGVRTYCPDVTAGVTAYVEGEISGKSPAGLPEASAEPVEMVTIEPPKAVEPDPLPLEPDFEPEPPDFEPSFADAVPIKAKAGDMSDLLDTGQVSNFNRAWREACPEGLSTKQVDDAKHAWLRDMGYVDSEGVGTSKAIPKAGWILVRDAAAKFAAGLKA